MKAYPSVDQLEVELSAGQGVAVIVEGDSYADDPFFYRQWFDARAREVAFFPQDGWAQVVAAVAELRLRCAGVPVYGIIDRDFYPMEPLDCDFAERGVLRTPSYTLENYLLDPAGWAEVFRFIFRAQPTPANGWNDAAQVAGFITDAYRACFVLSAHNQAIKFGHDNYPEQAPLTAEKLRGYLDHSDAVDGERALSKLHIRGAQLGAGAALAELFAERLAALEAAELDVWQQQVSGKYVLDCLHRRFPRRPRTGQFDQKHYLNEYLRALPAAPADLVGLMDRIIDHARK